jgi:hypothetical protein
MAHLYVGEQFWTNNAHNVTACSPKSNYQGRTEFIKAVNQWMDDHGIVYEWNGESTHEQDSDITYQYHVKISNSEHRTFFNLRWA